MLTQILFTLESAFWVIAFMGVAVCLAYKCYNIEYGEDLTEHILGSVLILAVVGIIMGVFWFLIFCVLALISSTFGGI